MNENALFNGGIFPSNLGTPFEVDDSYYRSLPNFSSVEELKNKKLSKEMDIFQTPAETLDAFLKETFGGIGIPELMRIYTKKHIGTEFCLPVVTPQVICYFKKEDNANSLFNMLANYQCSIIPSPFGNHLNLHNDTIYKFTLIRADFDLKENASNFFFGYHHESKNFHFFIKSSIQFDLTVVYEKVMEIH